MSRVEALAAFFLAHPGEWLCALDLEFAGRQAWRTRVSDLRRAPFSMRIENRQRHVQIANHDVITISEYMFVPEGSSTGEGAASGASTSPAAV